ncbi:MULTISPECIES: non-hydrolyzing UDP-N-acetylglucosamine 2-epimerase [Amycolatopsis]|uniref:UDP-N-acetylglucosamine 2-epimerase (non-hydrolyzing) n=1 Tax=Amycolatopsis dendrobii TaxID=2760662 RepID=A0A7W3W326_9PSEU|nr:MULTISPECIES: UDP-N-acetylglucosamine 2-epimerase (non-hydrolyzing) [Amycolatopsis]MBB1157819.1 UDP-N-acetylglucosamine 2-epimerase (non-hydrolyzing) [Amycolatopsis dendrobii]UKD59897.1 UDP-N-acetylglucosamine 2-epimerase (non-hydrolyzing) [Amycolatopsis sp. FU40]
MDVMLLAGTRPEAVKLAPLALALEARPGLRPLVVHSGQHQGMVEQALAPFEVGIDAWLDVPPRVSGTQAELVSGLLPALDAALRRYQPSAVVVQGDTTTGLAGALAAFWLGIPVVHLEAGLRTHDLASPFPEEGTRQMISRIAALHLVPTAAAGAALAAEGVPSERITRTGNTVVDAVLAVAARDLPARDPALALLEMGIAEAGEQLVLVTSHRRESWGEPLKRTLTAVRQIVDAHPRVQVLFPVHPNPAVREQVEEVLGGVARVTVTEPLEYPDLVRALRLASLVLTDSGGIQEEAPTFGTPVLVLRDTTERPEAVEAGCAWLVGTDTELITDTAARILRGEISAAESTNPYGNGSAAARSASAIEALLGVSLDAAALVSPKGTQH